MLVFKYPLRFIYNILRLLLMRKVSYNGRKDELNGVGLVIGVWVNYFGREIKSEEIIKDSVWILF